MVDEAENKAHKMRALNYTIGSLATFISGGSAAPYIFAGKTGLFAYNENRIRKYGLKGTATQERVNKVFNTSLNLYSSANSLSKTFKLDIYKKYPTIAGLERTRAIYNLSTPVLDEISTKHPNSFVVTGLDGVMAGVDIAHNFARSSLKPSGYGLSKNIMLYPESTIMLGSLTNNIARIDHSFNGKESWISRHPEKAVYMPAGAMLSDAIQPELCRYLAPNHMNKIKHAELLPETFRQVKEHGKEGVALNMTEQNRIQQKIFTNPTALNLHIENLLKKDNNISSDRYQLAKASFYYIDNVRKNYTNTRSYEDDISDLHYKITTDGKITHYIDTKTFDDSGSITSEFLTGPFGEFLRGRVRTSKDLNEKIGRPGYTEFGAELIWEDQFKGVSSPGDISIIYSIPVKDRNGNIWSVDMIGNYRNISGKYSKEGMEGFWMDNLNGHGQFLPTGSGIMADVKNKDYFIQLGNGFNPFHNDSKKSYYKSYNLLTTQPNQPDENFFKNLENDFLKEYTPQSFAKKYDAYFQDYTTNSGGIEQLQNARGDFLTWYHNIDLSPDKYRAISVGFNEIGEPEMKKIFDSKNISITQSGNAWQDYITKEPSNLNPTSILTNRWKENAIIPESSPSHPWHKGDLYDEHTGFNKIGVELSIISQDKFNKVLWGEKDFQFNKDTKILQKGLNYEINTFGNQYTLNGEKLAYTSQKLYNIQHDSSGKPSADISYLNINNWHTTTREEMDNLKDWAGYAYGFQSIGARFTECEKAHDTVTNDFKTTYLLQQKFNKRSFNYGIAYVTNSFPLYGFPASLGTLSSLSYMTRPLPHIKSIDTIEMGKHLHMLKQSHRDYKYDLNKTDSLIQFYKSSKDILDIPPPETSLYSKVNNGEVSLIPADYTSTDNESKIINYMDAFRGRDKDTFHIIDGNGRKQFVQIKPIKSILVQAEENILQTGVLNSIINEYREGRLFNGDYFQNFKRLLDAIGLHNPLSWEYFSNEFQEKRLLGAKYFSLVKSPVELAKSQASSKSLKIFLQNADKTALSKIPYFNNIANIGNRLIILKGYVDLFYTASDIYPLVNAYYKTLNKFNNYTYNDYLENTQ